MSTNKSSISVNTFYPWRNDDDDDDGCTERAANKSAQVSVSVRRAASVLERLALVHIAVILLLLAVLLASSCLGAQYLHRYRKYQLAAREDLESLAVSGTY